MTRAREGRNSRGIFGVIATALLTLVMAGTATAATYEPTTFGDDSSAGLTLREAIATANGTPDDDTVLLAAGTYELDPELGDLEVDPAGHLLIRGAGARDTTIDANGSEEADNRAFEFNRNARADVEDLSITGGYLGEGSGGAVEVGGFDGDDAEVTFTRVSMHGNELDCCEGGAIYNDGQVTLVESLIAGNSARAGGGIANQDELTVVNSTISGNEAHSGNGGGVLNQGFSSEQNGETTSLTAEVPAEAAGAFFENATIANNKASDGNGGGIFSGRGFSELSALTAQEGQPDALAVFHNSALGGNTALGEANCSGNEPRESEWASSNGYNIEDGETCEFKSTGDKDADPMFGALANNGGPTDTHALQEGSPAIDAADPDPNKCEDVDQRGVTRFQRDGCDMGAYEAGEVPQPPNDIPTTQQQQLPQQETPRGDTCTDRLPPITTLRATGLTVDSNKVVLVGRSRDRGDPCPSGVERVEVSMAKVSGTGLNCRFVRSANRFVITPFRYCRRPILFRAVGTKSWKFTFRGVLVPGKYRAQARGYDEARNKETPKKRRNIIVFTVK